MKRDLLPGLLELLAASVHRRDGDRAERGRGRDRPALVHVLGEHRRAALDAAGRCARRRGRRRVAAVRPPRTSALVIRPRGPVPSTPARSTPSTAATRCATGVALAPSGGAAAAEPPLPDGWHRAGAAGAFVAAFVPRRGACAR